MKSLKFLIALLLVGGAGLAWFRSARSSARPDAQFDPQPRVVFASEEASRPELAFTTSDTLFLLAGTGPADQRKLELVQSQDGGDSFTPPVAVSSADATVMTHGEMGPVLRAKGEAVFVLWQQHSAQGRSRIVLGRSTDAGKTFASAVDVVDKQPTDSSFNGFASLGLSPAGVLYAVWLDGRDPARAPGTFDVYISKSTDKGATWSPNQRVASQSCPCCRPAVAADDQGNVYVAMRKVFTGDQRDLAIVVSRDAGTSFAAPLRVAADHWTLHACPESGPSLLVRDHQVVAAWYSGAGQPGIRVAISGDAGATFAAHTIGAAVLDQNHPQLSLSEDGQLLLAFQGRTPSSSGWAPLAPFITRIAYDGSLSRPQPVPSPAAITGYPAVAAASAGRIFVASTQENMANDTVVLSRGRLHP